MNGDPNRILIDTLKRLLRRNALSRLKKIMNRKHAADLSAVFRSLSLAQQTQLFKMIEAVEQKGDLLSRLDEDTFLDLVEEIDLDEMVAILKAIPSDDAADLVGRLPDDKSEVILERMGKKDSEEVEDLLTYDDDSAGGIMTPDFIALPENISAKDAIAMLQKDYLDVEMPFYLYVVDDYGKLTGVSSLRQLVVVSPDTPLSKFMTRDVFSVKTDVDQEEVAKLVARYDILAVPVVDEQNRLVGIVTVDDVIDIFREEATEDILRMAGAGGEFIETKSVIKSTRIRLPWLFASCIGGMVAFLIINRFEVSLKEFTYLAAFIPVIMGMGGNIGTQSSTIVVRGLATGRHSAHDIWPVVSKELAIGLILGVVYGILIGLVAQFKFSTVGLALSVGLAVVSSMSIAALVGSLVPMLFARINIDPAVATGPFVTTSIDIISVYFYFQITTMLLGP
jgi:magnesium transporter